MLKFKKYDLVTLKTFLPYFKAENLTNCNYSLGVKFMWKDYFSSEYAVSNNTLTFKEIYGDGHYSFYFPIGENVRGMVCELKDYVLDNLTQELEFCCVDEKYLPELIERFPHYETYSNRNWSDYVYLNKNFQTFNGGNYSNKRHHVKQFIKLYPETLFKIGTREDKLRFIDFLNKFSESKAVETSEAKNEFVKSFDLVNHFDELGFDAFYLEHNGEIIALSICEVINNCIYDHVEKALRSYQSIYPYFVNKIANYYKDITYFDREDDAGDEGLRFSKEDYHPYKMSSVSMFYVKNNLDLLCSIPEIKINNQLSLGRLLENDKGDYFKLYTDDELNKYWGYDYRLDLKDKPLNDDYFYNMYNDDFDKKECLCFILKKSMKLIGELTLENLNNNNEADLGFRLFKNEQGKGYAYLASIALIDYLKNKLKMKALNSKAYKENIPSVSLIKKLNFKEINQDEKFIYFKLNLI